MKNLLLSALLMFSVSAFAAESKIVFVGATWCGACQYAKPFMKKFQKNNPDAKIEAFFYDKMDKAGKKKIFTNYEVGSSIPKYFFIRNGKKIARIGGALEYKELQCMYDKYVKNKKVKCSIPTQYIYIYKED